jgi:crotonobetainyl-CoA:carnitine CoA-transferase CaiB-like acyl-CoA transferase
MNPRLIHIALSGYGSEGPKSEWGSYGTLSEAASSVWGLTHYPDEGGMRLGDQLPDAICGLAGALAALRGLRQRQRTDSGCHFDVSQLEAYVAVIGEQIGAAAAHRAGAVVEDGKGKPPLEGVFKCAGRDNWVAVTVPDTGMADGLRAALDLRAGARTAIDLQAALDRYSSTRSKRSVAEFLQAADIPAFPVMTAEDLVGDDHLRERAFFTTTSLDGVTGSLPGSPIRPLRSTGRSLTAFRRHAPGEGEHSLEILRDELMLSEAEIASLVESRIVVQRASP